MPNTYLRHQQKRDRYSIRRRQMPLRRRNAALADMRQLAGQSQNQNFIAGF